MQQAGIWNFDVCVGGRADMVEQGFVERAASGNQYLAVGTVAVGEQFYVLADLVADMRNQSFHAVFQPFIVEVAHMVPEFAVYPFAAQAFGP